MDKKPSFITLDFQPIGRRVAVDPEITVLYAAQLAGIDLVAACSGLGICGTCMIRIINGSVSPPSLSEINLLDTQELDNGYRLACQCTALSDMRIEIPPESLPGGQKLQVEGLGLEIKLAPVVLPYELHLVPPTLDDLRSDSTRLREALQELSTDDTEIAFPVLASLSERLRGQAWNARAAVRTFSDRREVVGVFPSGTNLLGMAVDVGSTKLAIYLIDLETGATLAQKGIPNPQIVFGEDVISRIAFANKDVKNRELLRYRLIYALNQTIQELCMSVGCSVEQIVEAVLVGNTAIHHFVTFLPVEQLGAAPYVAAFSDPLEVRARDLGLDIAPGAWVYFPPIIAGYVGADHTSALLAAQYHRNGGSGIRMLIDIGTNTEISLGVGKNIYSWSTASGPAFEGAHIHDGMRAAPGAIEKVSIVAGKSTVATVGGEAPVGICGTGILQAISELLRNKIITTQGTLRKDQPGVRSQEGRGSEYLLVSAEKTGHGRDIVITRKDINEIQLAKGAIRAGVEILLSHAGIPPEDVEEWVIAGAFGSYLNLESAVRIGMFPKVSIKRFHQVGNAAGTGAKQMLLSLDERNDAVKIVKRVEYIELTAYPEFTQCFVEHMSFSED
ncbi:MAG: DUF4445 domain-containing protein [Anaerolineaceae bacterium]|nr:DUF4445 domain-containing protein [Anaerolineaceae bacterium]